MAARLTDLAKKKIVADYLELGSYNGVAKRNGVSDTTVRRIVNEVGDFAKKMEQKKEENTEDIIAYMERQRSRVCEIIDAGLAALPEKVAVAKSATEVTTAIGTLIDKWTQIKALQTGTNATEVDPLTASIEALGASMEEERERSRNSATE